MVCPRCSSPDTTCKQKYKPGDVNRLKYSSANLNRRRYICLHCDKKFFTVEILEDLFEAGFTHSLIPETKTRLR